MTSFSPPAIASILQHTPLDTVLHQWDPSQSSIPRTQLSGLWQMLILGDGSMTRTLSLLTGQSVSVEVLATQSAVSEGMPREYVGSPTLQRRVFLGIPAPAPTQPQERLLYAVSWWSEPHLSTYLPDQERPIGTALADQKIEVFRDIRHIYTGTSAYLNEVWNHRGNLWGRRYCLWHQQRPFTLIDEVFSPGLSRYLGLPSAL